MTGAGQAAAPSIRTCTAEKVDTRGLGHMGQVAASRALAAAMVFVTHRPAKVSACRALRAGDPRNVLDSIRWSHGSFPVFLSQARGRSSVEALRLEAIGASRARRGSPREVMIGAFGSVLDDTMGTLEDRVQRVAAASSVRRCPDVHWVGGHGLD